MKRNIMLTALATGVMALAPVAAQAAQDQDKAEDAPEATAQMSKGEKKLAKALEGRVAGEPVRCIQLSRVQSSTIYDDTAIVYRIGRTLYVNRPDSGASSLNSSDIMVTQTVMNQLCSVDTVQMRDNTGFMRGVIFLGEFVPYDKPKKEG
ncbi:hypothetical protein [Croceicoccus mobilis]|uniref:Uncharacterized protein n=1 Tax=Croceicoccus mobilis TaxID=1703339 RepID=A0A916YQE5_9SPHN|nr:hypothetical protein [Croceicoccus mobilis]GGD56853.1 hypothetical protein GCM10010990_02560 [Croceicoccus mobilis]